MVKGEIKTNYQQAIEYIHGTLKFGSKLGLENIKELLRKMGDPQDGFKVIHVGGTNGKGSVTSMITNILICAGYNVGMFISPYLEDFNERIQINLEYIPNDDLARIASKVKLCVDDMVKEGRNHPTEFEIITAIGFTYFAEKNVDYAVVEVGLGGRLDSTNVVDPVETVITSISYDHMNILGNTIQEIAFEKAGIIKPGRPIISYPQIPEAAHVLSSIAKKLNAPYYPVRDIQINAKISDPDGLVFGYTFNDILLNNICLHLIGRHQLYNAATALTAIMVLKNMGVRIPVKAIYDGMEKVKWRGRLEKISENPDIIIDGAHNHSGALALANAMKEYFSNKNIIMVIGILRDKEVDKIISELCPIAHSVIVTRPDNERALEPEILGQKIMKYSARVDVIEDIDKAVYRALNMSGQDDVVLICGSLYLVGRARKILKHE